MPLFEVETQGHIIITWRATRFRDRVSTKRIRRTRGFASPKLREILGLSPSALGISGGDRFPATRPRLPFHCVGRQGPRDSPLQHETAPTGNGLANYRIHMVMGCNNFRVNKKPRAHWSRTGVSIFERLADFNQYGKAAAPGEAEPPTLTSIRA